MKVELESPRIELAASRVAWMSLTGRDSIVCESGSLWITIDGELRDIVLEPGESLAVERPARLLVYALEDARFSGRAS